MYCRENLKKWKVFKIIKLVIFSGIYYKSKQPKTITPIYSIEYSSRRGDEIEEISTISGSEGKIHNKLYFVLMYNSIIYNNYTLY